MHVLINAASAHMGGALTYLQNVLPWLPRVAPEDRFIVYLPKTSKEKIGSLENLPNVQLEPFPHTQTGGLSRLYFDQYEIPRLVRQHSVDVLYSSTGFGTFFSGCPEVLLVRNPVYFSTAFAAKYRELERSLWRNRLRRWHSLLSVRRADVVLFPTRAMQTMVEQYIELEGKDTRAIHYGFDHDRFWQGDGDGDLEIMEKIREWRAQGYYILLNVSTYAVHKNFETLIRALHQLISKGLRVKLLTTTSRAQTKDKREYSKLRQYARGRHVDDAWIELGYVPYQSLHKLYQAADLFVFPSFTESFGHSLVEAMAAGLPIVAADMPVNREVCGKAGVYFETFDAKHCARSIARVLENSDSRRKQVSASKERAPQFSWHRYVEQLVEIFQSVSSPNHAFFP
jgi:glycosyltransferase involved in cell wall biosynthesis